MVVVSTAITISSTILSILIHMFMKFSFSIFHTVRPIDKPRKYCKKQQHKFLLFKLDVLCVYVYIYIYYMPLYNIFN